MTPTVGISFSEQWWLWRDLVQSCKYQISSQELPNFTITILIESFVFSFSVSYLNHTPSHGPQCLNHRPWTATIKRLSQFTRIKSHKESHEVIRLRGRKWTIYRFNSFLMSYNIFQWSSYLRERDISSECRCSLFPTLLLLLCCSVSGQEVDQNIPNVWC